MVETSLSSPGGHTVVNIQVDPTRARGEGGPEYPRLVVPIDLTLTPERGRTGEKFFFLLRVRHTLHPSGRAHTIADALDNSPPSKLISPNKRPAAISNFRWMPPAAGLWKRRDEEGIRRLGGACGMTSASAMISSSKQERG